MIPNLSQETITEYASEAQTIQEPTGNDYVQGVKVGKTIPAKWWNWLFRAATRRLGQVRVDAQNMLTELQNVVTDAGMTLDGSNDMQLVQATRGEADKQITNYVNNLKFGFTCDWYETAVIIDDVSIVDVDITFDNLTFTKNGESLIAFARDIAVTNGQGTLEHHYYKYSTDFEHWYTYSNAGTSNSMYAKSVCINGKIYSFNAAYYVTKVYVNNIDSLAAAPTQLLHVASNNGYPPFMTLIDGIIYVFADTGALYKIDTSTDTVEQVQAVAGLYQHKAQSDSKVIEAVTIDDRVIVGNLIFTGSTFEPLVDASDDYRLNAVNIVLVKRLRSGNLLVRGTGRAVIVDTQGNVHDFSYTDVYQCSYDKRYGAADNDIIFKRNNEYSLDGLNFNVMPFSIHDGSTVIKLQNRYFITRYDSIYYTDNLDIEPTLLYSSGTFRRTSLCLAPSKTYIIAVLEVSLSPFKDRGTYAITYDAHMQLIEPKLHRLDGSVVSIAYRTSIDLTGTGLDNSDEVAETSAVAFRNDTSEYIEVKVHGVSKNSINRVIGNTLYLR